MTPGSNAHFVSSPAARHRALAVDRDMDRRIRIKQAAGAVHQFETVVLHAELNEALADIKESARSYDVIFLSERLEREEVLGFMKEARQCTNAQDAAFILLLSATESESAKAAQSVLAGFDGCLMEPYSVESFLEITELASRVKKERSDSRQRAAIQFLLKDVMRQIDRMAYIRSTDMDGGATLRRLKEACEVLSGFDDGCMQTYFTSAVDLFEHAQPNAGVGGKNAYQGVSSRIKQRMVKRMIDQEQGAQKKS